jgi:hypothetical protein
VTLSSSSEVVQEREGVLQRGGHAVSERDLPCRISPVESSQRCTYLSVVKECLVRYAVHTQKVEKKNFGEPYKA